MLMERKNRGITLVSLVVTVIILIILGGVSLNLILGENGIIKKSQVANEEYNKQAAIEAMDLKIANVQIAKYGEEQRMPTLKELADNFSEDEDFEYVQETSEVASIARVISQNPTSIYTKLKAYAYEFEINNSLQVANIKKTTINRGKENTDIIITANVENATDYTKATLNIQVAYEGKISSIQINGQEETIPEKTDGIYVLIKEVVENGKYTIVVKDSSEDYKIGTAEVTQITEDMDIYTEADLEKFRDNVNSGRTYEGRTINIMDDINLSSICGTEKGSWIPIGDYATNTKNVFKGTLEGNNKTITGLYVNTNKNYQGLFGRIENAEIKNLKIKGIVGTSGKSYIGLLAGHFYNGTVNNITAIEESSLIGASYVGGLMGRLDGTILHSINLGGVNATGNNIGGICGYNKGNITRCGNKGIILGATYVGGITGQMEFNSGNIEETYNEGRIEASGGMIGGISGSSANIYYCYNKGNVTGKGSGVDSYTHAGGIVSASHSKVSYCYNRGAVYGANGQVGGISGNAYNAGNNIVQNCYNTGAITGGSRKGSIIGQCSGASFTSCWWTSTNNGNGNSGSYTNSAQVSAQVLKGYVSKLGAEYFTEDTINKNDGFPIFKWEVEEYNSMLTN